MSKLWKIRKDRRAGMWEVETPYGGHSPLMPTHDDALWWALEDIQFVKDFRDEMAREYPDLIGGDQ